ncbi:MAG: glycosyltransferase [Fusobacterium ulcerans]|uniref:glycosyltransferase n=1 Tax=Fusobacterium ulcerans TaxID=861 RepID=UPI003A8911A8
MKIIFILGLYYPYIGGGAEVSNKLLVEGIQQRGIEIEVITLGEKDKVEKINNVIVKRMAINKLTKKYLKQIRGLEIKIKILERIKRLTYKSLYLFDWKLYNKINKILEKSEGDILHISGIHFFVPLMWMILAKKNNMKVIYTLRDPFLVYIRAKKSKNLINLIDFIRRKIYSVFIYKYVDYIHSPSQHMIDLHLKNKFKFKNSIVIPNTVKIENQIVNFENKDIDILYVGRLEEEKGINTLIETIEKLKLNNKSIFVGKGTLEKLSLKAKIKVTGWISKEKTYEYMKKAKVLILPSEWEEAFGRVLIEGIANGTLVIGSDQGAIPEVLGFDKRYIFKTKSAKDLKEKIIRVLTLSQNEYKKEIMELQKYIKKYSYKDHIEKFEEFYFKVLNN